MVNMPSWVNDPTRGAVTKTAMFVADRAGGGVVRQGGTTG